MCRSYWKNTQTRTETHTKKETFVSIHNRSASRLSLFTGQLHSRSVTPQLSPPPPAGRAAAVAAVAVVVVVVVVVVRCGRESS
ncbi:hypothetical protein E2C01_037745 [Portunus trituberculatus]|uniref:Uncharacterized protein n=1 Tax=Portunus trituberculatus TaxID=210409 RepID=A0A5B7FC99_PORTR|nr:hypothetical protein [Portunus trituberculatus]